MDFQSAMETFAEAWVAANTKVPLNDVQAQSQALALTKDCKTPPLPLSRSSPYSTSNLDRDRTRSPPPVSATTTQSHSGDIEGIVSSPMGARSIKEEFDLTKSTPGKSLPVHCVVETVNSLEETPLNSPWRRRPVIETDSYVIIPINTVFHELVQVALQRLGYSSDSASAAKGSVVIKNWKPLSFDKIADGPLLTVGDILGELTTVATLRIQVYRARPSAIADIKDKLLRLFLAQAHGLLLSTGCPLDEIFLSQICRTQGSIHGGSELSEEVCRKFDQWFLSQVTAGGNHSSGRSQTGIQVSPNAISMAGGTVSGASGLTGPPKVLERSPSIGPLTDHVHPALQTVQSQYPTQKTRMRTSFDPELELPKLQSWFAENQHPSRQQIQLYVKELNGLESRRGRKPLDVNNVVYWFKNARAAQKRAETRGGVMSQGNVPCHLGVVNGYNSNVHSPSNNSGGLLLPGENYMSVDKLDGRHHLKSPFTSGMIRDHSGNVISNDMSNGGSDLDDDDDDLGDQHCSDEEPPNSPTAPLSLTTTSRNQDQSNEHQQSSERSSPLDVIKEEPNSDSHPRSPETNVNNNNHKKSAEEDVLDMDEDETDDGSSAQREESPQQHRSSTTGQPHFGPNDDPLYRIDLNRPAIRSFRTPTPEMDTSGALIPHGGAGPGTAGALDRIAAGFPLVPNSMFSHSIMYMSHYIPGLSHGRHGLSAASPPGGSGLSAMSAALASSAVDERRKRNRTFIDPVTEVPRLEQWFSLSTHPSHNLILKYTEELNRMPYRQKFPRLEPKNVQFWFKNRRAKCKRLKMALYDNPLTAAHTQYHHTDRD